MIKTGIKHAGCVNRIKYNRIGPTPVAAAWGENGTVAVWNLSSVLGKLDQTTNSKEVYRCVVRLVEIFQILYPIWDRYQDN